MEGVSKASLARAAFQLALGLLLCAAFAVTATSTPAPLPTAAMMPAADRLEIEQQLTEEVQARVNR